MGTRQSNTWAMRALLLGLTCVGAGGSLADALLDQPPLTGSPGLFSDVNCDVCLNSGILTQLQAEDFTLTETTAIGQITIWGFYVGGPVPSNDVFTVIIHEDAGGLPGPIANGGSTGPFAVVGVRIPTGNMVFGVDEYEIVLDIPEIALLPGKYWVEIYTDSGPDGDFDWSTGSPDLFHSDPGEAFAQNDAPGVDWEAFGKDLAIQICEAVPLLVTLDSFTTRTTPDGLLLEWTTASEIDHVGFHLLRGTANRDKTGPLERITLRPIPSVGSALAGAHYEFLDNVTRDQRGYVYYLQDIDVFGRATLHGPVYVDFRPRSVTGRSVR